MLVFEDAFEHGGSGSQLDGWFGAVWDFCWDFCRNFIRDFCGGWWGYVWEAFLFEAGRGVEFSDDGFWFGDGIETAGVDGGEVEAVQEGSSVLEVDAVGGDGVDGFGDGDLDGDGVFERAEVEDGSAALEVWAGDDGVAVDAVGSVEALVEVAEDVVFEGDGLALQAVGADVAADGDLHENSELLVAGG